MLTFLDGWMYGWMDGYDLDGRSGSLAMAQFNTVRNTFY